MNRHDSFQDRHIGPRIGETKEMLKTVGADSLDDLINQTIPESIRLSSELNLAEGLSEYEYSLHVQELAAKNKAYKNFIGQGYYGTIIPAPIQRNVLENPGWYTAYTPYQAEISQGRLQALLNFQTVISDLTGLPIANASLLDEGTAAAEGALMLYHSMSRAKAKSGADKFFIDSRCYDQTIAVVKAKAEASGIKVEIGDVFQSNLDASYFGILLQYPDKSGSINDFRDVVDAAKQHEIKTVVATDLMALTLLTPPGEWGADVVVGNSQRFGVPMGFGGPHAGFFATQEDFKRNIPGRIIGVSVDRGGRQALRMALQTREQHIRRDKATSNICTAQALLAVMASMYAVYHGPQRLKSIALEIAGKAKGLADTLASYGVSIKQDSYFDTISISGVDINTLKQTAEKHECNFWYHEDGTATISVDETTRLADLNLASSIVAEVTGKDFTEVSIGTANSITESFSRNSEYLTHPIFNSYQSETDLMRYIKSLENKDISLTRSMISLGSCTMKLNAASELYPITNPSFSNVHPFVPLEQADGYVEMINELENSLAEITGFDRVSFQPNSGAQGEYAGLMVIREFHQSMGNHDRNIVLIPSSAHGTNPASAVVAGMKVVVVKCDEQGNIDVEDLRAKAEEHNANLGALMVTYPSTHGVFEEGIKEMTQIIHDNGGQVYMDGANMNAQVGLTNPATIGADVCHLNLHKTFAIPHGGGGPGVGPIGVAKHLSPFLPGHPFTKTGGGEAIGPVSSAPFGSSLILLISYAYVKMLGRSGLTDSTKFAILNANYLKEQLKDHFPVLYTAPNGRVAHEMILDCRPFKKSAHVGVTDIAKRLIDFGFHAPTVSFPVAGTIMVEPTESESKAELDRFIDALKEIKNEIVKIEAGERSVEESALRNAPHTADILLTDHWDKPYSREEAAFPVDWARNNKYWVPVARIDDAFGDRNLVCACPPTEEYAEV
ncbi:MAG: aminomethyl-transferring glycine dehydrogenase [Flavobacteriales bacterium]|jgi:glycine dehydrogenase|nr:aminomethyl-transferring glycine dehydrogenase [Flavobacteriales bacterium]MBT3963888.1 aminomethyl-transferring glycine dehydrogenase [Flavobacteriales bacterium]MBT4706204.1 aminomethyl-transferring glycine dehydrogenase [Flavobacteriales bacterium]MBT4931389.1 aminomethyl-transferring glycine dehydrogenase [Flavobacteriales bacterium]MBT5133177.1 aminomethyl-transferring glycine dehydrogenase [Flavobacteriales bacterium]